MTLDLPDFGGRARCADTNPALFFPGDGGSTWRAKRICKACPVVAECLEWALQHHEAGVWGGTSERQRRAMKPARPLPKSLANRTPRQRKPIPHGTNAGYSAHLRRKEPMCGPCREARTAANAAIKQKRQAS